MEAPINSILITKLFPDSSCSLCQTMYY